MAAEQASHQWPISPNSSNSLTDKGKLQNADGTQWIVRNTDPNSLPYSAVFRCDGILMKLQGEDRLFIADLSEVSVDPIFQLDNSMDFDEAIGFLKKHIMLGPVLRSRNRDKCDKAASYFENCLTSVSSKALGCPDRADGLLRLCRFFKKHHYRFPTSLVRPTCDNQFYTSTLNAAKNYFEARATSMRPGILLNADEQVQDSEDEVIKNVLQKVVRNYQQKLTSHRTSEFTKKIKAIEENIENIFLITLADIELFSDLEKIMTNEQFKDALRIIRGHFLMVIQGIPEEIIGRSRNMSNRMYYFVLKSLIEVSKKLSEILRHEEVVTYDTDKWTVVNIPKDHKEYLLKKSLRQQLKMLVKLANHYEPGKMTVHQRMPYNFNVKIENPLQDDVYVFLCFLDDSLNVFMSRNIQTGSVTSDLLSLKIFENLISSGNFTCNVMDSLCSITQHVLDLLGKFFAMIINTANTTAQEILQKQISILERGLTERELHDYLNVFISCWELCNSALQNITSRLAQHIPRIQNLLLLVVSLVLDKNKNLTQMFSFFKNFEEFLIDLKNLDLTWYVRLQDKQRINDLVGMKAIELVDNKWKETEYECYIVKNVKVFTTCIDDRTIPKHYQVAILECFLENIIHIAQKWTNEGNQLDALSLFIATISTHFPHFKRQPDYIDFETFFSETVEPFRAAVENSALPEEINKQMQRIEDTFRRIKKTKSIGIETILKLFHEANPMIKVEKLKYAYTTYQTCFEGHIIEHISLNRNEKITQIIKSVQSKTKPMLTSVWSEGFNKNILPEIVADLAAAWSMIASKDSDRYIIPHSVQILCILRLLSVDQCGVGVTNHLAQVLAGQGKSMILGLIAALLALLGHNVSVNCYSRYLAERDADNFKELFQLLNVSNRISYTTINDMMDNHTTDHTDRSVEFTLDKMGLPKKTLSNPDQNGIRRSNSVLLVDEMDGFLADTMYRNKCILTIQPQILGLDAVQLKIWDLIQSGDTNCTSIKDKIYEFISTPNDARVYNLKKFIENSQKYSILVQGRKELLKSEVTNRTLFSKHLHVMILSALKVHREPSNGPLFSNYKLYKERRITCRNNLGKFTPLCVKGYYNTFVYFKLKGNNFMQNVIGCNNFGYFVICVGELSSVKFLASHSLILGVTGNLIDLDSFEKHVINKYYKIDKLSIMPSFFGLPLLKFDKTNDFTCISTEVDWIKIVINRIHDIINTDRSVLVFFDTEVDIDKFKEMFISHPSSFNLLTVNTEAETKEQFINDAGVVKTVTLATREMGRGVDFKSSATVEKNGGIHVIQTFFSLDINEERQIQGRTTRKTHRGSYEQIVCIEHLVNLQLINPKTPYDLVCYEQLDSARKNMAKKN